MSKFQNIKSIISNINLNPFIFLFIFLFTVFIFISMTSSAQAFEDRHTITEVLQYDRQKPQQSTTGPTPSESVIQRDRNKPGDSARDMRSQVLLDVPSYLWRHGCGPTALGMIIGYYDGLGFDDLVQGDTYTQTDAVNQMIASGGDILLPNPFGSEQHFENYSMPIDNWSTGLLNDDYITSMRVPHEDNSLADYMHTSKSSVENYYGWSWSIDVGPAFLEYVNQQNSDYQAAYEQYWAFNGTMTWDILVNEIDEGRPMVFLVDSSGNGYTDHFVTVIGYRTSPTLQYGMWDTWFDDEIRWENFHPISNDVPWGVWGGWRFIIGETFDDPLLHNIFLPLIIR